MSAFVNVFNNMCFFVTRSKIRKFERQRIFITHITSLLVICRQIICGFLTVLSLCQKMHVIILTQAIFNLTLSIFNYSVLIFKSFQANIFQSWMINITLFYVLVLETVVFKQIKFINTLLT